ncbi:4-diphosphocytidyl-2-C-methyl-D-erythritol kinase [Streptomyces sp. MBT84]|nr:4-diphosphocytidyl-2-C-methyl-D-erythritol kinase [Streptomyces sp. MBT84]
MSVTVRVPAKVNVQLAVGGARPDGFHDLANVFLAVGLYDEITVTPADALRVTCSGPDAAQVPLDVTNLAARAALALAGRHGFEPAVHIHIAKDIPIAGGMAGGSADGAGALVACDALWGTRTSREELLEICTGLGSDVPFSLVGGAALGTGRGEKLTVLEVGGTFHWVFAMADRGLSTPAVFREFDRLSEGVRIPEPVASQDLLEALAKGTPERSRRRSPTTSSRPRCPCSQSWRRPWTPGVRRGRSPRWCRDRDPRRRFSPGTRPGRRGSLRLCGRPGRASRHGLLPRRLRERPWSAPATGTRPGLETEKANTQGRVPKAYLSKSGCLGLM